MARSKKEQKKPSVAERLIQRWDQQVFFLQKQFPNAQSMVLSIKKNHEKLQLKQVGSQQKQQKQQNEKASVASVKDKPAASGFMPTEEALNELNDLYNNLKGTAPAIAPLLR